MWSAMGVGFVLWGWFRTRRAWKGTAARSLTREAAALCLWAVIAALLGTAGAVGWLLTALFLFLLLLTLPGLVAGNTARN